jgi:hypothetical protein
MRRWAANSHRITGGLSGKRIYRQSIDQTQESIDPREKSELESSDFRPARRNNHPTIHGDSMTHKKKLIEVALPLDAINKASAREKSIRHGHPSTLHLWWARRPLAAARAVIFAQMVDDPSAHPDLFPTPKAQEKERQRLFRIIEDLVLWENTTNEKVLQQARDEIWQSWRYTCAENADHPRAGSSSTATSCRPFTILSPAAERCRWRPSAWVWRATPAI